MEENFNFYDNIIEKTVLHNTRSRTVSTDLEDSGLTIDSELENHKISKCNNVHPGDPIDYNDDDELSIGCDEDETTVNFYVKVEKPHKPERSVSPVASKKTKIELEPFGKEKQDDVVKCQTKQNNKIKLLPNKCPMCKFEAVLVRDLRKHMKSCVRKRKFNCLVCPFMTRVRHELTNHKEHHSLKDAAYKCTICTYGAKEQTLLNQHLQLHFKQSKLESKDLFQCPLCPFADSYWRTLMHFRLHAMEHEQLKDVIECPLCGMKTKNYKFSKHTRHHITLQADCNPKCKVKSWQSREERDKSNGNQNDNENTDDNEAQTDDTDNVKTRDQGASLDNEGPSMKKNV